MHASKRNLSGVQRQRSLARHARRCPISAVLATPARQSWPAMQQTAPSLASGALPTGLAVTWLGTSSGCPTQFRNVSCIVVQQPHTTLLVDCGEGTVRQLQKARIDPTLVDGVFITHLHGDHCFGLPGVLQYVTAARAAKRPSAEPLRVYGPPGIVQLLQASGVASRLRSQTIVSEHWESAVPSQQLEEVEPGCKLLAGKHGPMPPPVVPQLQVPLPLDRGTQYQLDYMKLSNRRGFRAQPDLSWRCKVGNTLVGIAQLQHRVPCWGYVFMESASPGMRPRKVVILGDTMDSSAIAPLAYGADLLSHESTFMKGMEAKAKQAQHSTAWMAGLFARRIAAKQLVLTHFSARYDTYEMSSALPDPRDAVAPPAVDEEMQSSWMSQLLQEAITTYGSTRVSAAQDFFTVHVPR